jgi:hypothetical protein
VAHFYKLDGKVAIPVDTVEYHRWVLADPDHGRRVVALNEFEYEGGEIRVSTVFILGINHGFDGGEPILFETMLFGGPMSDYQARYSTWEQAEAGHASALEELFQQVPEIAPSRDEYATRFERILRDD